MFNTLLFIHLVISLLLIVIILIQKTSTDGLSGIGGGGNNMGLVSGRAAANFLTKTTIFLAVIFFVNALILANISSNNQGNISKKLDSANFTEKSENIELDQIPTNGEASIEGNSDDTPDQNAQDDSPTEPEAGLEKSEIGISE